MRYSLRRALSLDSVDGGTHNPTSTPTGKTAIECTSFMLGALKGTPRVQGTGPWFISPLYFRATYVDRKATILGAVPAMKVKNKVGARIVTCSASQQGAEVGERSPRAGP
jgi:hypothetical protein